MFKDLNYGDIGYEAATFKVDDNTIAYLKANHTDASTGRVDVNGKNLAVKLSGDNTVGFGGSTPAATDALFGIIIAYEEDGFASVQYKGFVEAIPVNAAISLGTKELAVNNAGKISEVSGAAARAMVTKAATANDKEVTIYIG